MNYLDELLAIYIGRDVLTQKYLVHAMGSIPEGLDGQALIQVLRAEMDGQRSQTSYQARHELGRVMPLHLTTEYGLAREASGVWTSYQKTEDLQQAIRAAIGATAPDARWQPRLARAQELIAPAMEKAHELLETGTRRVRQAASLCVGAGRSRSACARLIRGAGAGPTSFFPVAALSQMPFAEAQPALLEVARTRGLEQPDLLMLLETTATDRALGVLADLAKRGDSYTRMNVALALHGDTAGAGRDLLRSLVLRREGWVTAWALSAVARAPRAEDLTLVTQAFQLEPHEFVRVQAVKVAGHLPGDGARAWLLERLADPAPRVQAAALEALARQGVDRDELTGAALPLLESPLLRARINAVLVLARTAPSEVAGAIQELLFSDQPVHRLEAAYVLGYLKGPEPVVVLHEMARSDPSAPVRLQAVKSLAKQPANLCLDRLLALVGGPDAQVGALATRAVVSLDDAARERVVEELAKILPAISDRVVRGQALRALGAASGRLPGAALPPAVAEALESADLGTLRGALEGVKVSGSFAARAAVRRHFGHPDSRVAVRAALAGFWIGELDALEVLTRSLTDASEETRERGLRALLELVALLPQALLAPRYARLAEALDPAAPAPAAPVEIALPGPPAQASGPAKRSGFLNVLAPQQMAGAGERLKKNYATARPGGGELTRTGVEELSYLVNFPSARTVQALLRSYGPLLLVPVLLAIPAGLLVHRMLRPPTEAELTASQQARTRAPIPAGKYRITVAKGTCTARTAAGVVRELHRGELVEPGELLTTGPTAAQLSAQDGAGDLIWMEAGSAVSVGAVSGRGDAASLAFSAPAGDITWDARHAAALEIALGTQRFVGIKAMLHLAGGTLTVMEGDATLTASDGGSRHLAVGEPVTLGRPTASER